MVENWSSGIALIIMSGILQGSFALPLKYTRKWSWENTWLSYSLMAYLILPWLIAFLTVPQLKEILQQTSTGALRGTILFGFGWGLGCLTFGLGIDYLGMALGFAITLGLTAAIGTLIPLLVLSPEKLMSGQGALLIAGIVTMLAGISLCSWAGKLKETELKCGSEGADQAPGRSVLPGVALLHPLGGLLGMCKPRLRLRCRGYVSGHPMGDSATICVDPTLGGDDAPTLRLQCILLPVLADATTKLG